ncbi:MAG TPA: OmpW family outer membrane protein [Rhizomicrobium sp.]|nr:OmpW family outer membrane protein [Rhizomicrobium sp.]
MTGTNPLHGISVAGRRAVRAALFPALGLFLAQGASAASDEPQVQSAAGSFEQSPWYVRAGILDAIYDSGATFREGGQIIPGATARVSDGGTAVIDIGYDVTRNFSLLLMTGFPPKPSITGEGTVSSLKMLGKVRYGSTILSAIYRVRNWGRLQPYLGMGVAYAIIIKPRDGAINDLWVHDNFGFALQAGAECPLDQRWGVFVDVKKVFLSVDAGGNLGATPVTANVKLNPVLVSTGITVHFN